MGILCSEEKGKKDKKNEEKIKMVQIEDKFKNIKSKYILQKIFNNLDTKRRLYLIRFNKNIKKRLDININDYKEYLKIEIELKLVTNKSGQFINTNNNNGKYFHIYFNNNKDEIRNNCIIEGEKIKIIKVIIDYQIKSFRNLFWECKCIESINFYKFKRNDINNMSNMFYECSSLKELNLNNFNTNNVTNMSYMFYKCSSLKELNLNNFNNNNVTNMRSLFFGVHH